MPNKLEARWMLARQQGRPTGTAGRTGYVTLLKVQPILSQLIDIRSFEQIRISVFQIVPTQVIYEEQDDVRFRCPHESGKKQTT